MPVFLGSAKKWNDLIQACNGYNFYQSYEWGEFKKKEGWSAKRFYLQQNGHFVIGQCLIKKFFALYIVWLPGGPLLSNCQRSDLLEAYLKELTDYCRSQSRLYYLRLNCQIEYTEDLAEVFNRQTFSIPSSRIATNLNFIADKKYFKNIDENLTSNWKRNLKRSERSHLKISIKDDIGDIDRIIKLHEETIKIKKLKKNRSKEQMIEMGRLFQGRMITFLAYGQSGDLSARVILRFGKKAFDLLAATNAEGRKKYASYYVVYRMLRWCAEQGLELFDFSGVDAQKNIGVYNFKKGTGSRLVTYVGEREKAANECVRRLLNIVFALKGIGQ